MSEHKIGDLALRYYMGNAILGYIVGVDRNSAIANPMYEMEWIDAPDCSRSAYEEYALRRAKKDLEECLTK